MKKYIAEFLGTFTLTLVVALSITGSFPISTPVLAALVLGLFVYSIGHISGSHINPAVTIGLWSIKKISNSDALKYIIAQFIGAGLACLVFSSINNGGMDTNMAFQNSYIIGLAELLGTFFFTFFIASVVYGKTPNDASGVVIGGGLLLGISVAVLTGSFGIINPAVAFGIGYFNLMYTLAPVLGGILGMQAYKYLES